MIMSKSRLRIADATMASMARTSNRILCGVASLHAGLLAWASEYHGQVFFDGLPVPGVKVTSSQGGLTTCARP